MPWMVSGSFSRERRSSSSEESWAERRMICGGRSDRSVSTRESGKERRADMHVSGVRRSLMVVNRDC